MLFTAITLRRQLVGEERAICNRQGHVLLKNRQARWFVTKTLQVMQLTAGILLFFSLSLSARSVSQTISLSGDRIPMGKIFSAIKQQTGYQITGKLETLKKSGDISVHVTKMDLKNFLELILKDKPYDFEIVSKTIFIRIKSKVPPASDVPKLILESTPITGTIRDANGSPLGGVNVIVKGTKRGTTSNADGTFLIDAKEGEVLIFSSVGYSAIERRISGSFTIEPVVLQLSESKLDEVQIIAYGTTTQRLSTGNVSSVKAKDIEKQPVGNPLLALQGRVPGLMIIQSTGLPGSGVKVSIQGVNSIKNGNDPFYVIDGVPYLSQNLASINDILGFSGSTTATALATPGNPLSYLNPGDIESIEVLKDADATAIYGSRAANGAILITTKRGKQGKTQVELDVQQGFGEVPKKMKLMNTQQYLEMRKLAIKNDGLQIPAQPTTDFYDLTLYDQNRYTDWQKVLIGNKAGFTNLQSTVSGGTNNLQALFGANYHNESTVFPGKYHDEKIGFHFNISGTSTTKKFSFNVSGTYSIDVNKLPSIDLTEKAMKLIPNAPALYDSTGKLNWELYNGNVTWANPLGRNLAKSTQKNSVLMGRMNLSYELLKGLKLKADMGYTNIVGDERKYTPQLAFHPSIWTLLNLRSANFANTNSLSWILEPQITYTRETNIGKFDCLIGSTFSKSKNSVVRMDASGFNDDSQIENIGLAFDRFISESEVIYNYNALFGRLGYNYDDTYIFNLSMRRDGSSRFGPENLFHNFYSVGAAWIFTNMHPLQKLQNVLNYGKLKLSYGTSGNDQIGDYNFLSMYDVFPMSVLYNGGNGLTPGGHSNPYLQWEETKKINAGIELGFLRDKLLLNINYYRYRSSNQLLNRAVPYITGFAFVAQNFDATVQNAGIEITLNTKNISNRTFQWSSNFTISSNKNKLLSYKNFETSSYRNSLIMGMPITITKTFSFAGVNAETGIYEFKKNDGTTTSAPLNPIDKYVIINSVPKYFGLLNNSFVYKRFSLDIDLHFVKQIGLDPLKFGIIPGRFYAMDNTGNQPVAIANSWRNKGDNTSIQKVSNQSYISNAWDYARNSDYVDASFIKLKNVSFSWTLPAKWLTKARLQNARLYMQGQNLLTVTPYKGINPEASGTALSLPPLRVATIGLKLTF